MKKVVPIKGNGKAVEGGDEQFTCSVGKVNSALFILREELRTSKNDDSRRSARIIISLLEDGLKEIEPSIAEKKKKEHEREEFISRNFVSMGSVIDFIDRVGDFMPTAKALAAAIEAATEEGKYAALHEPAHMLGVNIREVDKAIREFWENNRIHEPKEQRG